MNHDSPARNVSLPAVTERDAVVHQVDPGHGGEGGALQCLDVAQVTGVSVEGFRTGVVLLVRVEVTPSRPAVVPGVSSHVNMEPVLPGAQTYNLPLDEDSVGSLLQDQRASNVEISSCREELHN